MAGTVQVPDPGRFMMPIVTVQMYDGRTLDQKRELVKGITDVVARVTGNSPVNSLRSFYQTAQLRRRFNAEQNPGIV